MGQVAEVNATFFHKAFFKEVGVEGEWKKCMHEV